AVESGLNIGLCHGRIPPLTLVVHGNAAVPGPEQRVGTIQSIPAAGSQTKVVGLRRVFRVCSVADEGMLRVSSIQAVQKNESADLLRIKSGVVPPPLPPGPPPQYRARNNMAPLANRIYDRGNIANGFVGAYEGRKRIGGLVHLLRPGGPAIPA